MPQIEPYAEGSLVALGASGTLALPPRASGLEDLYSSPEILKNIGLGLGFVCQ